MIKAFLLLPLFTLALGCGSSSSPSGTSAPPPVRDAPVQQSDAQKDPDRDHNVITLTPAAGKRVRELLLSKPPGTSLRVGVKGDGATGFTYDLDFAEKANPNVDFLGSSEGVKVVVDQRSALFLEGATIDWEVMPDGKSGFRFNNPNATKEPPVPDAKD
jgi:iron-sulfur cluster assembly protein